jgi:drug/metabolite transporter (DMT)-like permease
MGIGLVAVSAAAFGTLAIFGRQAYAEGMDTFTILWLRFSLAAVVMLGLLRARGERLPRGPALLRLAGMGALGYVGQASAYLTALKYASAGLVALLLYLYPVFVALLAALVLRERLTATKGLALALAVTGMALTVGPGGGQALGAALAVAAAAIYSVYIIVGTQVLRQVSAMQSSTVIFAAAGLAAGGLTLVDGPRLPGTAAGWMLIAAIVVVATVVPVTTFLAGLERIGPTNAAMLSTLEPVVTVALAAWWLGERPAPLALAGGGLILAGAWLALREKRDEGGRQMAETGGLRPERNGQQSGET